MVNSFHTVYFLPDLLGYFAVNIPAVLLMVIYIKNREKFDTDAEITKMNIQDIE